MDCLESYVPEFKKFAEKYRDGARRCREDVAVIDVSNGYRIIAGRGEGVVEGHTLSEAFGLSAHELSFLESMLVTHRRVLLRGGRGAVLVFAEAFHATGLLLAVCPHAEAASFYRALCLTARLPRACSAAYGDASIGAVADESDCQLAEELFFYMDRIFAENAFSTVYARGCLIAHFAGYRPELSEEAIDDLVASKEELARLHMFLFCLFFRLRHTAAPLDTEDGQKNACRIKFYSEQGTSFVKNTGAAVLRELLELPAFASFSVEPTSQGILLRMRLPKREAGELQLQAVGDAEVFFAMQIAWLGVLGSDRNMILEEVCQI